jgi:hypothetical protein
MWPPPGIEEPFFEAPGTRVERDPPEGIQPKAARIPGAEAARSADDAMKGAQRTTGAR